MSILALLMLATAAAAQAPQSEEDAYLAAIEAELPGTLLNNPIDVVWTSHGDDVTSKIVKAPDIPGQRAFSIRVKVAKANPWDIAAHGSVSGGVAAGETVLVAFWARAGAVSKETGAGGVQARLQQRSAPYNSVAETRLPLGENWQVHYFSGVASEDFPPGTIEMSFNVGDLKQTVELGQYFVMNLGPGVDPASLPSGSVDP